MSDWAKPGARCICVDVSLPASGIWTGDVLVKGRTYTIEGLVAKGGLLLIEARQARYPIYGYFAWRFRPLVTRSHEEDMTVFRKIASNLPTAKEMEDSVQLALERLG